jgi:hypothetical protein
MRYSWGFLRCNPPTVTGNVKDWPKFFRTENGKACWKNKIPRTGAGYFEEFGLERALEIETQFKHIVDSAPEPLDAGFRLEVDFDLAHVARDKGLILILNVNVDKEVLGLRHKLFRATACFDSDGAASPGG